MGYILKNGRGMNDVADRPVQNGFLAKIIHTRRMQQNKIGSQQLHMAVSRYGLISGLSGNLQKSRLLSGRLLVCQ